MDYEECPCSRFVLLDQKESLQCVIETSHHPSCPKSLPILLQKLQDFRDWAWAANGLLQDVKELQDDGEVFVMGLLRILGEYPENKRIEEGG